MTKTLYGLYVSFSGESEDPISNVYALTPELETASTQVLGAGPAPHQTFHGLRGMAFGPDGNLYVAQGKDADPHLDLVAHEDASAIFQFSGAPAKGGSTLKFLGPFVTPASSPGLSHPYQPLFSGGDLYVSSQNTNVVTAFYGPKNTSAGKPMPNSKFLQGKYPQGKFNPGTFVPAHSAKKGIPGGVPPNTSIPVEEGGLTFKSLSPADLAAGLDVEDAANAISGKAATHSVRGLAFDNVGNLYVADEGADRVTVFDTGGKLLGVITGPKNYPLSSPVALFFAPGRDGNEKSGKLHIGSPGNKSLFIYDVSGIVKKNFEAKVFVFGAKELNKLSGIVVDPDGNVYTGQRGPKKKTAEDKKHPEGNRIYKWSSKGDLSRFAGPFDDSPEQIISVYTPLIGT